MVEIDITTEDEGKWLRSIGVGIGNAQARDV